LGLFAEIDAVLGAASTRLGGALVLLAFVAWGWFRAHCNVARLENRLYRVMTSALAARARSTNPFNIGDLVRAFCHVPRAALDAAVARQGSAPNLKLGDILQAQGVATERQVGHCLQLQQALRNGRYTTADLLTLAEYTAGAVLE